MKAKVNTTKIDFIDYLSKKKGFSQSLSRKLIGDLIEIFNSVLRNNDLILKNIGSFKLLNKKERLGRNPKTNKEYIIKSRKSISFISSKNLNDKLNN